MARLTYRDRLQAIIDNPACGSRDRSGGGAAAACPAREAAPARGKAALVRGQPAAGLSEGALQQRTSSSHLKTRLSR